MELWKKEYLRVCKESLAFRRRLYLLMTPEHGNFGDHAIALAEIQFIKKILPGFHIIEIQADILNNHVKEFSYILNRQMLIITGGGFWGTLWPREHIILTDILQYCKKSRIVLMPQTIFFENGQDKVFYRCKDVVEKHKNLSVFLRDRQSYDLMKKMCPSKEFYFCPDMVTSLDHLEIEKQERKGIMICFREDKEKMEESKKCKDFFADLKEYHGENIVYNSTYIQSQRRILARQHKQKVYSKLREFSGYKLVITDRLHAMLFSAITGTPCIALDNISGKVRWSYEWIKKLDYIYLAKDLEEVKATVNLIDWNKEYTYVNYNKGRFYKLAKVICSYLK